MVSVRPGDEHWVEHDSGLPAGLGVLDEPKFSRGRIILIAGLLGLRFCWRGKKATELTEQIPAEKNGHP